MFGGGCFWGVEHIFAKEVAGVIDAVSGYSGGRTENPTYKQVCYEDTGHVEVVQITFDPSKVSYEQLVNYFYRMIDPTQMNGQGPDLGEQYRSVIFYYNEEQKRIAEKVRLERQPKYKRKIAVVEEPAQKFWKAEDYHQDYYVKTGKQPYCHVLRPE
jgi:methionine-S-sulfoxide reductase